MVVTTSPVDRADVDLEESQRSYHRWHLESSEISSSKVSAQPPPHMRQPTTGSSSPERRMSTKIFELIEGRSCGRIL